MQVGRASSMYMKHAYTASRAQMKGLPAGEQYVIALPGLHYLVTGMLMPSSSTATICNHIF